MVILLTSMHFTWFSSAFLNFWIFRQIKEKDIISRAESILQNYWIIWYPFCISVLKIRRPKFFVIHLISIHSTWFSSFLSFFGNFLKLKKGEPSFLWVGVGGAGGGGGGTNSWERLSYLVASSVFQF